MGGRLRILAFMSACLFMFATTAWAGWVVTYSDAESGEQSKEYYQGDKANFDALIYDGRNFIVVSHESDSYWKGSPDKYCTALRNQKKQMEAQLAMMPEQYRPKPLSTKKIDRRKVSTESIAGFKSTGYDFIVDGSRQGRVWVSRDSRLSGLINLENDFAGKMKCFEDMDAMAIEGTKVYRDTVRNAFVVKESHRQVVSVDEQNISSGIFAPPKGYKSFNDYQKFMNHVKENSRSSSTGSSSPRSYQAEGMSREDYQRDPREGRNNEPESRPSQKNEDNVIVKDAKEIADDSVDEAHQSTKKGIKKEVSKDIKKGVNKFLKKIF